MPDTVLDAEETAVNKTNKFFGLMESRFSHRIQTINNMTKQNAYCNK